VLLRNVSKVRSGRAGARRGGGEPAGRRRGLSCSASVFSPLVAPLRNVGTLVFRQHRLQRVADAPVLGAASRMSVFGGSSVLGR